MTKLKKSDLFAVITLISLAVGYVEARIGALFERIDQVTEMIGEGRETLQKLKQFADQLEDFKTDKFFFPLPVVPQPDSDWKPHDPPPPPPLEPFPDPIGGFRGQGSGA